MGRSADSPEFQHFARPAETVELPVTPAMAAMFARKARTDRKVFPIVALGSLALMLITGNARRNPQPATFLRSRGLFRPTRTTDSQGYAIYWLRVGEHNFEVTKAIYTAAAGAGYGTVDYTTYGNDIIELRDSEERVLYRMSGYSPAESETGGAPQPT